MTCFTLFYLLKMLKISCQLLLEKVAENRSNQIQRILICMEQIEAESLELSHGKMENYFPSEPQFLHCKIKTSDLHWKS